LAALVQKPLQQDRVVGQGVTPLHASPASEGPPEVLPAPVELVEVVPPVAEAVVLGLPPVVEPTLVAPVLEVPPMVVPVERVPEVPEMAIPVVPDVARPVAPLELELALEAVLVELVARVAPLEVPEPVALELAPFVVPDVPPEPLHAAARRSRQGPVRLRCAIIASWVYRLALTSLDRFSP
jgi:hypothetical protein